MEVESSQKRTLASTFVRLCVRKHEAEERDESSQPSNDQGIRLHTKNNQ